jgi:hypothetical protein
MPSRVVPRNRFPQKLEMLLDGQALRWVTLISLLGIGLIHALWRGHDNEAIRGSISAMLDAIFIASFLAIAVDPVLKKGLLKEGVRNIFRYLYGYSLPSQMQEFYEETIVGTKFFRTDCELHWTVSPIVPDQGLVECRLHASFGVLNFIHEEQDYTHEVFAVNSTPGAKDYVEIMYCKDLETRAFVYHKDKDNLQTKGGDKSDRDNKIGDEVNLPPRSPHERSHYRFGVHYYAEALWPNGLDQFIIKEVTSSIDVIITVDATLKDCYFDVMPSPPDDAGRKKPTYDPMAKELRCTWRFARLFVPNEVLVVRWQLPEPEKDATQGRPILTVPS